MTQNFLGLNFKLFIGIILQNYIHYRKMQSSATFADEQQKWLSKNKFSKEIQFYRAIQVVRLVQCVHMIQVQHTQLKISLTSLY